MADTTRSQSFRPRERRGRDSNPRWRLSPHTRLAGECLQPLGHLSGTPGARIRRRVYAGQCKGFWGARRSARVSQGSSRFRLAVPYNNPPSPADGLRAVSRLLALAAAPPDGARPLQAAVAAEARDLLGVPAAVVDRRDPARNAVVADGPGEPRRESVPGDLGAIDEPVVLRSPELSALFERGPESLLVLSLGDHVLVLAGEPDADL